MNHRDGPYFDDLIAGQTLEPAPAIEIGVDECSVYDRIVDDPLALARSAELTTAVTGHDATLVNPGLVLHAAIGQSTVATRHVIANLFYRGVRLRRPVHVGTTLTTEVTIRGMSEATRRPDRPRRGKVLLGMATHDQHGDLIIDFERCALLPFRDEDSNVDRHDDFGGPESSLDLDRWRQWVPGGWDLGPLGAPPSWPIDESRTDPSAHTVEHALDLIDLTQNQALAHRDARFGQSGRRLVYGGHTIALAQTSLTRLMPSVATIVGWHSCDHLGPVFEHDTLSCEATLTASTPVPGGRLLAFELSVEAHRADTQPTPVLDWQPVVYGP